MDPIEFMEDIVPQGERWPPLGAAEPEEETSHFKDDEENWHGFCHAEDEKLQLLEEEQEQLNSSLMALTSHFAQVQFRLKQIVDAEPDMKEKLLRELEEFAFRGIPDFHMSVRCVEGAVSSEQDHTKKMEAHRLKQQELIAQLKQQLEDLERYAYETGEAGPPQTLIVERQKVVIDQMKNKLQLNLDDLDKLTVEELQHQVDLAISQLVNPLKMKEQLVCQLKTQISDLERFIEFLQGPADKSEKSHTDCHCICPVHSTMKNKAISKTSSHTNPTKVPRLSDKNHKIQQTLRHMSHLLQMFIISQFGCGGSVNASKYAQDFPSRETESIFRNWKARLDGAVLHILRAVSNLNNSSYDADDELEVAKAVRKGLCPVLRDFMSHGLIRPGTSVSLVPFLNCASARPVPKAAIAHPWQLLVAYYHHKDGQSLMNSPQRCLAQSFSLEIQGGTNKQSLLTTIGSVIFTHSPYKRGPDAHFKAFISIALNSKKLVPWLRIIYRSPTLLEEFYESSAYCMKYGFDDVLKSLEPLQNVSFNLPEDLSIRSLRNISDAF